MNYYQYIVACHIIFIVTWFSGLFYIVRLYIYHTEALQKQEPERSILSNQYQIMEKRLMSIITTPSMILVLATGITLVSIQTDYLSQNWLLIKLVFVAFLIIYHFYCLLLLKALKAEKIVLKSQQLRLFNEVTTILLVAIVFLVELKNAISIVYGLGGLFLLIGIMLIAIKLYKKKRQH